MRSIGQRESVLSEMEETAVLTDVWMVAGSHAGSHAGRPIKIMFVWWNGKDGGGRTEWNENREEGQSVFHLFSFVLLSSFEHQQMRQLVFGTRTGRAASADTFSSLNWNTDSPIALLHCFLFITCFVFFAQFLRITLISIPDGRKYLLCISIRRFFFCHIPIDPPCPKRQHGEPREWVVWWAGNVNISSQMSAPHPLEDNNTLTKEGGGGECKQNNMAQLYRFV